MIVESKPKPFTPVTITLESHMDADLFMKMILAIDNHPLNENLADFVNELYGGVHKAMNQ